ncbi:MAG: polyprenyl synthetase family protein [Myxococcota bacterium]|jgi:octaprenyl-diphosphate synthase|nr:polyprenyl synthetase family protein [Myxococcota bacterium]
MAGLPILERIAHRDGVGGRISDAISAANRVLDGSVDELDRGLSQVLSGRAPGRLEQVVRYALESGGKRIRPVLCLLAHRAAFGSDEPPLELAAACELLHNSTLLHDDVVDEGQLRRGRKTARVVFGNALSVLAGDYLLVRTVDAVTRRAPSRIPDLIETMDRLVAGELIQLEHRGSVHTTKSDYFAIVEGKTASLFRFAALCGAAAAGAPSETVESLARFGWHVGICFQIVDDILDFSADPAAFGKSLLADISEGKLTLPVILARDGDPQLLRLLRDGYGDDPGSFAAEVSDAVRRGDALELARDIAATHTRSGIEALSSCPRLVPEVARILVSVAESLLMRGA